MSRSYQVISELPYKVQIIEHTTIPMPDGTSLAARIWLPEDAYQNPVPGILEYIPYRKRDMTRNRDAVMHGYFAGHGYACIRVDLRGSGESEGVLEDEYLEQELVDGEEVLEWIAHQPWCTGKVGIIGKSWGGFNGLQLAARRPASLHAVISVCSTDDRYADDVHYMGGCLLGDNLSWASTMFAYNSLPPDPELVGEKWREMWLQRLKGSGLWLEKWLHHQTREEFWKHGSICEDFDAVQCPVMAVSGWADGYTNAVFRLMSNLNVPRQGLIGPWSHKYPHSGIPGPAIGFLQEAIRWWDYWLKGRETGIMQEPMLRTWMQDFVPPRASYKTRPGHWVAENQWPSPDIHYRQYGFAPGKITESPDTAQENTGLTIQSPLSVGLFAGKWCSYSATPDMPHDQREEDGGALVFDSDFLEEDLKILGAPVVNFELSANQRVGMIAIRLSSIAPDDKATRITYGIFNLTHRDSHEFPENLEPGQKYRVSIQLNDIAQTFPKGHRIRISVSTSYWPLAWPAPQPVRLTIYPKNSELILPLRNNNEAYDPPEHFYDPCGAPPSPTTQLEPAHSNWFVKRDLARDEVTLEVIKDDGKYLLEEIDLEVESDTREWYSYRFDDFDSLKGETFAVRGLKRDGWHIKTETRTILESNTTHFLISANLDAYENEKRVFSRNWNLEIPRNKV